jgi:hypothetical protein
LPLIASDCRAHQVVSSDHSAYNFEALHSGQAAKTMADADGATRPFHKVIVSDCRRLPLSIPFWPLIAADGL